MSTVIFLNVLFFWMCAVWSWCKVAVKTAAVEIEIKLAVNCYEHHHPVSFIAKPWAMRTCSYECCSNYYPTVQELYPIWMWTLSYMCCYFLNVLLFSECEPSYQDTSCCLIMVHYYFFNVNRALLLWYLKQWQLGIFLYGMLSLVSCTFSIK